MAKRKRRKKKDQGLWLNFKAKKAGDIVGSRLKMTLKIWLVLGLLAMVVFGFVCLNKYVKKNAALSQIRGTLKMDKAPIWVNKALEEKLFHAAVVADDDLLLDDDAAKTVQKNIERNMLWLTDVTVHTTADCISVSANWRKPVAVINVGAKKLYVDNELVLLDFVPLATLPIVKVEGLSWTSKKPVAGTVWWKDDLAAAVDIISELDRADSQYELDKPLLGEIATVNVANFNGRKSSRKGHIIFYTTGGTKIVWGAALGTWQRYLEATDSDKIAKLYGYYQQNGSLSKGVKYIDLRNPSQGLSLPEDKY